MITSIESQESNICGMGAQDISLLDMKESRLTSGI
jgi:hypothetical protein